MKKNNTDIPGGVLLVDKEAGWTSHDCVNRLRRLYQTSRVGHTGTLDPMATGLLVTLVGRAAKAAEYLAPESKRYEATLLFGQRSDTGDSSGKVCPTGVAVPSAEAVGEAAGALRGEIMQVPPMYSAVKIGGQKLVDLARRGIEIERPARAVTVYSLTLTPSGGMPGEWRMSAEVSGGTYIRTLITDLGDALGCGAVMTSLRRETVGAFSVEGAPTATALAEMSEEERFSRLIPTERLFDSLPVISLPPFFARLCRDGLGVYLRKLSADSLPSGGAPAVGERVRLYADGAFFAVGEVREQQAERGEEMLPAVFAVKRF